MKERTIFVRNVPYDVSDKQLAELFSNYGKVEYAKCVRINTNRSCFTKNAESNEIGVEGSCKGTAFVKFENEDSYNRVLQNEEMANEKISQILKTHKTNNLQKLKSINTSALLLPMEGLGIMLNNRRLYITHAVDRSDAEQLRARNTKRRLDKMDYSGAGGIYLHDIGDSTNRNIDLIQEGYLDPNSNAYSKLSKKDKLARDKAWKEKNVKIRNCNYYINKYRLSIRNLEKHVDNKHMLKVIKELFVRKHKQEKKKNTETDDNGDPADGTKRNNYRVRYPLPKIKILEDKGNKSRGFGYISFPPALGLTAHTTALMVLRELNNNEAVSGNKEKLPIIDFAVEDRRKVRLLNMKKSIINKRTMENQNI